jgi:hypothetical protein
MAHARPDFGPGFQVRVQNLFSGLEIRMRKGKRVCVVWGVGCGVCGVWGVGFEGGGV